MQDLFKALIESETAQNDLAGLEAKAQSMRGELNGMLGRDASAPLGLPPELPPPRPVTADDAALIAVAVSQNPELKLGDSDDKPKWMRMRTYERIRAKIDEIEERKDVVCMAGIMRIMRRSGMTLADLSPGKLPNAFLLEIAAYKRS